ncbi:MATE family efflux transporter [Butyrivibrio sp. FC2001]|jgi:putative MATE family efflux protein|uniref:MATE family efflux transporter n=1 Tax=Butyrivibrio sp. FC2001 TaxID=1280671 RepID=UPI000412B30A|nr:MATE family efflux transporter [Butyrivibrio sp. FC2001]
MKKTSLFAPVDMTEGTPVKQIITFTIPMLLGNIAQQLYNTADSIIVGRFVGDNALAAVGSAGPLLNLMLVLFMGISVGASIMVSQYFGARKREDLSRTIGASITLTGIASLFIMLVGPIITRPILELLGTPESIIDWCTSYLWIIFIGIAGSGYYNIMNGVLRGLGDSVSALIYLLVATFLNIGLDLVFVAYLGMGVAGVALATVIAQFVSAFLSIWKLTRMSEVFDFKKEYLLPEKKYSGELIRLGFPSGVTQAIFSMSMIVVQNLTNTFGAQYIAANVIVMRVDGFVMLPAFSFGSAMTTFAGQNIGAGKMERVEHGAKSGTIAAMAISAFLSVLILIFGRFIMGIFTSTEELITLSYNMMRILIIGYIAMEVTQCLSGIMRGAGDTTTPMWISMFSSILMRVPMAYIFVYLTKSPDLPQGNCYMMQMSMLVTWTIGAFITYMTYKRGKWKTKAI